MATVLREPEQSQAPSGPSDGGQIPPFANGHGPGPAPVVAETPVRLCKACGAGMGEDQDWCLQCGTARPGRLGGRPGWRAAAGVSAATLVLVCGAVAASYAAITNDAGRQADTPAGASATPIAQAPAVVPTPGATAPGTPGAAGSPLSPITPGTTTTATTGVNTLPGATGTPATGTGSTPPPITSVPPYPSSVNNTGTTTSSAPTGTVPKTTTPTTTTGSNTTTTGSNTTTTGSNTTTPPAPPALSPISVATDAADLYDPYQRASAKGDPSDAVDPKAKNAWFVTTPADGKPMQVGLLIDLESRKTVRQLEFATTTPGFRLEVYATDGSALPPDILDTRWAHVASRSGIDQDSKSGNVKGDGKEIVKLPSTTGQVRKIVLWFTTPPAAGATVRLRDIVLKG